MGIIIRKVKMLNSYYFTIQENEEDVMVSRLFETKEECYRNIEILKEKIPYLSQISVVTTT